MPMANKHLCGEAIKRMLTDITGGAADAGVVAGVTLDAWRHLVLRLEPVIGVRGVEVLFRRSLYLTSSTFPCLEMSGNKGDTAVLLANLASVLAGLEVKAATETSYTLLVNFTELLSSLIGNSLTERLLEPVWTPQSQEFEEWSAYGDPAQIPIDGFMGDRGK